MNIQKITPQTADSPFPNLAPGWHIYGKNPDPQNPFDVAVVMPTIGRDSILEAVSSVYAQKNIGRIQLLIGVDAPLGDFSRLHELLEAAPDHVTPCLFYPGYSTSVRHGGLHPARDGGALRTTLSYLANARYIAYLDDDNWWAPDHLSSMLSAIQGREWAFAQRWFVHPESRQPVCIDDWESVGPGRGFFVQQFGGWVDPNCLVIDKLACEPALRWWSIPLSGDANAMSADRHVYDWLQKKSAPGETGQASVYYAMQPEDDIHPYRLNHMGSRYAAASTPTRPEAPRLTAPTIAVITICKGRLDHLKQTLPLMLGQSPDQVVVVDYGCPQHTGDWVEKHYPQCKVVRVMDDQNFNAARARNIGAAAAEAKWLCCLDADVVVQPGWLDWLRPRLQNQNVYFRSSKVNDNRVLESYGMACVSHSAFDRIGGYDEAFCGWGAEDDDFFSRLMSGGFEEAGYPPGFINCIPHSDDHRTQFYEVKNKEISRRAGICYLETKKILAKVLGHNLPLSKRNQIMQMALSQFRKQVDDPLHIPFIKVRFDTDNDIVCIGSHFQVRKELVVAMEPIVNATPHEQPMISCLMVTKGRPEFVKQAIGSFIRQTYLNKELVIVSDAPEDVLEQLVHGFERPDIRLLHRAAQDLTLGELRNLAVANARGRFVCQWDDDDIYDPQRLEYQYSALAKAGAQACLLNRWTIWWPAMQRLAVSPYRNWEGSLLCEKAVMPEYSALHRGEDTPLVDKLLKTVRVVTIDMPHLYLYVVHGGNTFDTEHFEQMYQNATERHEGDLYHATLSKLKERLAIEGYPSAS